MSLLNLPLSNTSLPSLELEIEPIEGHEKGTILLGNITIFKTPSGTILIYGYEN